jgi:phosphoglycolate phosphatase-like HAD superfamily hydrolase
MKFRAVLFDVDDTLLKTHEAKWRQHKYVAKTYYGHELTDAELAQHWGKPFDELVMQTARGAGTPEERRTNYLRHELEFPKEYHDDALETIRALHAAGLVLGLVTSMRLDGSMIDFRNLNMPLDRFDVVQGSEATEYHKPDPRVFAPALQALAVRGITDGILYVGDALSDYLAARDAGLAFVGLTHGFVNEAAFRQSGAEAVFHDLKSVKEYILRHV